MDELSTAQISRFINEGYIKVEKAFPSEVAAACRAILWEATQCDPDNTSTWTQPVIRIGELGHEPFKVAANTKILRNAFDQLTGRGNWLPRETLGSFPIRFPSKEPATDTGWHVDASFPGDKASDYFEWRVNIHSRGRALLMLFLFSDVSEEDAPTIIRVGSHVDVANVLEPEGEKGLSFVELAQKLENLPHRKEALATGKAGTVYLSHPFIAHAAQAHHGTSPKFMAQPPLLTKRDLNIHRQENELCPVEKAIVKGLRR